MLYNPHFRILALTATPGSKPEAVQQLVDALHISHIEIRSENDPDLKKYLHTKVEEEHFVHMTEEIAALRDAMAAMMNVWSRIDIGLVVQLTARSQPLIKTIQGAGYLKNGNVMPTVIHPYRCTATLTEMRNGKAPQYATSAAAQLGVLARAMGYLVWCRRP